MAPSPAPAPPLLQPLPRYLTRPSRTSHASVSICGYTGETADGPDACTLGGGELLGSGSGFVADGVGVGKGGGGVGRPTREGGGSAGRSVCSPPCSAAPPCAAPAPGTGPDGFTGSTGVPRTDAVGVAPADGSDFSPPFGCCASPAVRPIRRGPSPRPSVVSPPGPRPPPSPRRAARRGRTVSATPDRSRSCTRRATRPAPRRPPRRRSPGPAPGRRARPHRRRIRPAAGTGPGCGCDVRSDWREVSGRTGGTSGARGSGDGRPAQLPPPA